MGLPVKQIMEYIKNYTNEEKFFGIIGNPISHSYNFT